MKRSVLSVLPVGHRLEQPQTGRAEGPWKGNGDKFAAFDKRPHTHMHMKMTQSERLVPQELFGQTTKDLPTSNLTYNTSLEKKVPIFRTSSGL
jgi:hypothetical protein